MVIASNYGQAHNPAWYHNLLAHPEASIIFEGEHREVVARGEPSATTASALVRRGRDLSGLDKPTSAPTGRSR